MQRPPIQPRSLTLFLHSPHKPPLQRTLESRIVFSKAVIFQSVVAETEGFEPSVRMYPYDGLANRWFQPLTHVSGSQQCAGPIARA
jgi:hypothetical protein